MKTDRGLLTDTVEFHCPICRKSIACGREEIDTLRTALKQEKNDTMKHNNWRLERIASSICSCVLTDGFCSPRNKPDCRCWTAARAAVSGLENQADPVLKEAWPDVAQGDGETRDNATRRARLNALCRAILSREDELTEEQRRYETSPQQVVRQG